jgi:hypothetical protein
MYTRTYNENVGEIIIPERYGGTSFGQKEENEPEKLNASDKSKNPWENEDIHTEAPQKSEETVEASANPSKLPFSGLFTSVFKNGTLGLQKIGKEELLIIATAAFLFFSKEGDKECAIMLILLLFLK